MYHNTLVHLCVRAIVGGPVPLAPPVHSKGGALGS